MIDNMIMIITSILNFLNSTFFIHILLLLIIAHQVLLFFTKDASHIKILKDFADPKDVKLSNLNNIPLINIIIPAWKEGTLFEDCLLSITKLDYPNLKVIISAGGNEETIQIANSFKKFNNFIILKQKPGGKMKALNDCLKHVSDGIIYSIDADVILNNEILLRMLYPLVNENQYVTAGSVRPFKFQENIDIVKYILILKLRRFMKNFLNN